MIRNFLTGIVSALTISAPPLYRYPYRNSAEAFRGDWQRLAKDMESALDKVAGHGRSK